MLRNDQKITLILLKVPYYYHPTLTSNVVQKQLDQMLL